MSNTTLSGLTLSDRKRNSYFQDNMAHTDANGTGSPILGLVTGGIYYSGTQTYTNNDGVPFTFNAAGELKVDTELTLTSATINNVFSHSTDNTAANARYALVDSDGHVQVDILTGGVAEDLTHIHDVAIGVSGGQSLLEAKSFDGSALPNVVTAEGDAVRQAASLTGITYIMPVSEDGSETPLVAESAAISAANGGTIGLMSMAETRSSQATVLTNGDAGRLVTNLSKELVNAGYDWATQSNRVTESDPVDEHYVREELVDTTNLSADTYYYPSSTGRTLGNFNNVTIHGETTGGVTVTVEAKIDDSTDWLDITKAGYRIDANTTNITSLIDQSFGLAFDKLHMGEVRIKSVTSDNTNGVQFHWKLTAV